MFGHPTVEATTVSDREMGFWKVSFDRSKRTPDQKQLEDFSILYKSYGQLFPPAVFGHEATHLLQFTRARRGMYTTQCPGVVTYPFMPDRKPFDEYCTEEQGSIMEDYVLVFMLGEKPYRNPQVDTLSLARVVEKRFPHAQETRLAGKIVVKRPPTAMPHQR